MGLTLELAIYLPVLHKCFWWQLLFKLATFRSKLLIHISSVCWCLYTPTSLLVCTCRVWPSWPHYGEANWFQFSQSSCLKSWWKISLTTQRQKSFQKAQEKFEKMIICQISWSSFSFYVMLGYVMLCCAVPRYNSRDSLMALYHSFIISNNYSLHDIHTLRLFIYGWNDARKWVK